MGWSPLTWVYIADILPTKKGFSFNLLGINRSQNKENKQNQKKLSRYLQHYVYHTYFFLQEGSLNAPTWILPKICCVLGTVMTWPNDCTKKLISLNSVDRSGWSFFFHNERLVPKLCGSFKNCFKHWSCAHDTWQIILASISLFGAIYHLGGVISVEKHLVCKISDFAGQITSQIITQHNDR